MSGNEKPRSMRGFLFAIAATLLLVGCDRSSSGSDHLITIQGEAQGTTFTIKYIDTLDRDLSTSVDSLLKNIDRSLSMWVEGSLVNEFNGGDSLVTDDVHFRTVVILSDEIWRRTDGAFDPTVLPLVRAWGLGKEGRASLDTLQIDSLKEFVGMNKIRATRTDPQANEMLFTKTDPQVQFDPNGIAQGYSVDAIAVLLEMKGITNYMVEIGGEVTARGNNTKGGPWTIQIDKPVEGSEHVQQAIVPLQDRSLATSGNYRKFIEIGGRRYGHTIDSRTGRPAMNALLSASVIASTGALADALATALLVMGPDQAKAWLQQNADVEAYLIMDNGKARYDVWTTPGWPMAQQ
jgi:thiamine biosynthesis lipoprotein